MNKLHYRGDHRNFVPNRIIGPDMWGAWYLPVSAHYFDGVTTMFLKPVPPDQLPPHAAALSKRVVAQQQKGNPVWVPGNGPSPSERLPNSSPASQILRGDIAKLKKAARAGKGLTKSQRELLKRFKKPV